MKDEIYIVLNASGAARMTKRPPYLERSEIAVRVRIAVPDSAFRSPIIAVDLNVPDTAIAQPMIELEAVDMPPVED